jgi:hypothetical protein
VLLNGHQGWINLDRLAKMFSFTSVFWFRVLLSSASAFSSGKGQQLGKWRNDHAHFLQLLCLSLDDSLIAFGHDTVLGRPSRTFSFLWNFFWS